MSADYYFFAPTGGRYQTVFRGTLPRRYSIRRSQRGNSEAVFFLMGTAKAIVAIELLIDDYLPSKHD